MSSHAIYMPDVSEEDLKSALNLVSSGVTDPIYDITKFNRRMGARVFLKKILCKKKKSAIAVHTQPSRVHKNQIQKLFSLELDLFQEKSFESSLNAPWRGAYCYG